MLMEGPTASGRGAWDSAQAGVLVSVLALWPVRTVAHGAPVFNLALAAPVFTFESLFYEERASNTVSNFDKTVSLLQPSDTASLGASLVWAGAAGAGRIAVPHRCGVEAGGRRERRRRETRAERRKRKGRRRPCGTESRGDGDGLEGCLVQSP